MDRTDLQTIQRVRAGDQEAARELVEAHAHAAFRLALSILDDPAEAEEAAQDALMMALEHLDGFRQEAAFSTWLYTITANTCRMRLRKRLRKRRLQAALQGLFRLDRYRNPDPEEAVIWSEVQAQVWAALQRLGETERLVLILRYYHDLPIHQIAQVLQVNERTIYKYLKRAHSRLQVLLVSKTGVVE
jgi:RNA polymerase sigma-70 factor (ECF subfamily)